MATTANEGPAKANVKKDGYKLTVTFTRGDRPVANAQVRAQFADGKSLEGRTNSSGVVKWSPNSAKLASQENIENPIVTFTLGEEVIGPIDISDNLWINHWKHYLNRDAIEAKKRADKERLQKDMETGNPDQESVADCRTWATSLGKSEKSYEVHKCMKNLCKRNVDGACDAAKEDLASARKHVLGDIKKNRHRGLRGPAAKKRDLNNPDDVQAMRTFHTKYKQCLFGCVNTFKGCQNRAPSHGRDDYILKTCESPLRSCETTCENALNAEGFCLPRDKLTGKMTGKITACP